MAQALGIEAFDVVGTTQLHPLGLRVRVPGNANTPSKEYVYVKFGGVTAAGQACKGSEDSQPYDGVVITTSAGGANQIVRGVSVGVGAANSFGWLQSKGVTPATTALESGTVAAGDPLQASATTDGRLDIATAAALVNACGTCKTDGGSNAGIVELNCE